MTELLFRSDAYARDFTARVLAVQEGRVLLDRTLFYPEGGGQSADRGTLSWDGGVASVVDAQQAGGEVWHTLEGGLPASGTPVHGQIDWRVRYRHMQRHTGEHLLAQAFLRVNPAFRVVAVSMRSPHCTLDLEGQPGEADARHAEGVLMEVMARDLPVQTFEVSEEELGLYPLRRPPQVRGLVRLVGVREGEGWWEMSACGGTHLRSTAFAAPVVVLGLERVKSGLTRVTFVAGEEAVEELGALQRLARNAAQLLSVPPEKLPGRLEATLQDAAHLRAELEQARAGWAGALVQACPAQPLNAGGTLRFLRVPDAHLVTAALKALAEQPDTVGVVLAPDGRCGVSAQVEGLQAGALLQGWLRASGGRGGGRADLAQGQTPDPGAFERAVLAWQAS